MRGPGCRFAMRSGVHAMTSRCIKGENDDDDVDEGLGVATIPGTNSWRSHPVCKDETGNLRDGTEQIMRRSAERTRKMGHHLLFTWTHFTRFRVQTDALWQGGPWPCLKLAVGGLHPNQSRGGASGCALCLRPASSPPHCFPKSRRGMKQPFELEQAFRS